ncbi:MAG: transposase [Pseudomonadales bacterium]|nr:transposase [Pseudomonadales bacterium]
MTGIAHPFIERVIGSTRREFLDHILFFNAHDLQNELNQFQEYYNETREHSSLEMKTPKQKALAASN